MFLEPFFSEAGEAIDREIKTVFDHEIGNKSVILSEIITDHFGWNQAKRRAGKKIRPLLLLLVTHAAGGNWRDAIPAGAAIEIIHNFSLIHDDIEDWDEKRRGKPTSWKKFGVPQAINTGDALMAVGLSTVERLKKHYPLEIVNDIQTRIARAVVALTIGQSLDLQYTAKQSISLPDYEQMIKYKTASLIEESAVIGAMLGGMEPGQIEHIKEFGYATGMAFQIKDDWLGIWGDEELTGKTASNDLLANKKSLPIVYGMNKGLKFQKFYLTESINGSNLQKAIKMLEDDGVRKYVEDTEAVWWKKAKSAILPLQAANPKIEEVLNFLELVIIRNN